MNQITSPSKVLATIALMSILLGLVACTAQETASAVPQKTAAAKAVNTHLVVSPTKHKVKECPNRLAVVLKKVGFEGENLHEAWAIAMRESHGHPTSISRTKDFGLFQFNKATWKDQDWWKKKKLLRAKYNAKIAYQMSNGGETWYPWGLTGKGKPNGKVYRASGWSKKQVKQWIMKPFKKYYRQFNSLPAACK